ncbi:hypothetical protein CUMW_043590 [Citrus unshiu]|nr:hypothetical protein CUMW_043590 [Citrus unshiu]
MEKPSQAAPKAMFSDIVPHKKSYSFDKFFYKRHCSDVTCSLGRLKLLLAAANGAIFFLVNPRKLH